MSLSAKTLLITGASRGIGLAIGLRAAADGANVVVTGKTVEPHPKLPGTIHTAAAAIEAAGGRALAVPMDLREESEVRAAVKAAVARFGGIDILVNNASAIYLTGTLDTPIRRFDLMHQVNARGTFLASQHSLPHLLRAGNPHILTLAPPLNLEPPWLSRHLGYTMAKYGMSLTVVGLAEEFREAGVAVNALWPRTAIDTAAITYIAGEETRRRRTRRVEIMADAAHAILTRPSRTCTGRFFIDDEALAEAGVTDLARYLQEDASEADLMPDFFL
ncbi:MAG: NAD(P)-dependent oxidoreductase [Vicinamibacterales bacterium]